MEFELWPAVVAGLVGGVVMIAVRWAIRAAGVQLQMDVAMMWGTMVKLDGSAAYVIGWMMHLAMSALIGIIYAWGFFIIGVGPSTAWLWGLVGGGIHWLIAGMMMAVLPAMHPRIPERDPAPGFLVTGYGSAGVMAFLIGHLLYGLTFALLYVWLHPVV